MALISEGAFRADIYNQAGTVKLGVIPTVISVTRTRKLNEINTVEFTFPATDSGAAFVQFGRRYRIYHTTGGFIGEYIHRSYSNEVGGDAPLVTVQADSTLKLLANKTAKFNREINNVSAIVAAQTIVESANETDTYLGYASNLWACTGYDPLLTLGLISMDVQGQSILEALGALRKLSRANFRQTGTYTVEFGAFSDTPEATYYATNTEGIYPSVDITNDRPSKLMAEDGTYLLQEDGSYILLEGDITRGQEDSPRVLVTNARIVQSSDKVVNRAIVLGSGDGLNQLTMQPTYDSYGLHKPPDSTSAYIVKRAPNPDNLGYVWQIKMLSNGSGYTSAPTVSLTGGGGTGATATAIRDPITNTIIGINVTNGGSGYTDEPTVVITGGGGVGASAEAYINTFYYFIEDTDSIDAYGLYEAVLNQSDIRPYTNSDAQILYASDALYYVGVAYLEKNKDPQTVYEIEVLGLPIGANVGDAIQFRYRGMIDAEEGTRKYIDVDSKVIIMDLTETWVDGNRNVSLTVSTNAERDTQDVDIVLGAQRDLSAYKVSIQPVASREVSTKERQIDSAHEFEMELLVTDDVLYLVSASISFVTRPFRSVVNPNLDNAGTFQVGPTSTFTYYDSPPGTTQPTGTTPLLTATYDSGVDGVSTNRVPHYHKIPIYAGVNLTGSSTSGVPDCWYITWGGSDSSLNVGSAYAINNPPSWMGGVNPWYLKVGDGTGLTIGTEHNHRFYVPQHYHSSGGQVDVSSLALNYGIYDDPTSDNVPGGIEIYLDGMLIGANFVDGNNASRTLDITTALQNAPSGLRATHTLKFTCASGRGLVEVTTRLYMALQAALRSVQFGG